MLGKRRAKARLAGGGSWHSQTINAHLDLRTLVTHARDTALLLSVVTTLAQEGELPAAAQAALRRRVPSLSSKTVVAALLVVRELEVLDEARTDPPRRTVGAASRPPLLAGPATLDFPERGSVRAGVSPLVGRSSHAPGSLVGRAPGAGGNYERDAGAEEPAAAVVAASDGRSATALDMALRRLIRTLFHELYDPQRAKAGGQVKQVCDLELAMPLYSLVYTNEAVEAPGVVVFSPERGAARDDGCGSVAARNRASTGNGSPSSGFQDTGAFPDFSSGAPPTEMSAEHASHAYAEFLLLTHSAPVERVFNRPTPTGYSDSWVYVDEVTSTEGCTAAAHITLMLSQSKAIARSEYQAVTIAPCKHPDHQLDGSACGTLSQRGLHMSPADVGFPVRQLQLLMWRVTT